jgi:hypothetical protein
MKIFKHLLLISAFWCGANSAFTQTWIKTNSPLSSNANERQYWDEGGQTWIKTNVSKLNKPSTDYIRETELTPSVNASVPNSSAFYNNAVRLFLLQKHEGLAIYARLDEAKYGGKIVVAYDIRAMGLLNTNGMTAREIYAANLTNEIHLTSGYYRGRVYYSSTNWPNEEWITVFSSEDKTRLVLVRDEGPICFSENSGAIWKIINVPGQYEFTLSTTPKGSAIVARVSVAQISASANPNATQKMTLEDWYSIVSAADGSKLVIIGGPTQSAPVLTISHPGDGVVISWPASFTNFILQQNDDLTTTNWVNDANPVNVANGSNQVKIHQPVGNNFYRLKTP